MLCFKEMRGKDWLDFINLIARRKHVKFISRNDKIMFRPEKTVIQCQPMDNFIYIKTFYWSKPKSRVDCESKGGVTGPDNPKIQALPKLG